MPKNLSWLLETIDSESPGDLTVAPGATEASLFFIIDIKYIYEAYLLILGYCRVNEVPYQDGSIGGLDRGVEMSHPRYAWLYADSIEFVPISADGNANIPMNNYTEFIYQSKSPNGVSYKTFPYYSNYKKIRLQVKFKTRNYSCLTNEQLKDLILRDNIAGPPRFAYYNRDDFALAGIKREIYKDYYEYIRYTSMEVEPNNEVVVNQAGMGFWKSETDIPLPPLNDPNRYPKQNSVVSMKNSSVKFQNITKNKVKITWYKVPKILAFNTQYIVNLGKINQGPNFNEDPDPAIWNYNFFNFIPGTLLFLGITTENAGTTFPIFPFSTKNPFDYYKNQINQQYYNITFNFIQYVIPEDQIERPKAAIAANLSTGGRQYTNGWNFAPLPNRQFHYMENTAFNKPHDVPPSWAYPFQRFFDPLAVD